MTTALACEDCRSEAAERSEHFGQHLCEPCYSKRVEAEAAGSWSPVDLAPIVAGDGDLEPPPAYLARTDGERLLYAGKVHQFIGEPESGKGWLALLAAKECLEAGEQVLYIDFEDEAAVAVDRLRALGVGDELIVAGLHYVRPDEPMNEQANGQIQKLAGEAALVVIDGVTEALALEGIDIRDNTAVAGFMKLPMKLAQLGAAVVLIDHVAKDSESRGRHGIGAQHKLASVHVSLSLSVKEPFGRGVAGRVRIREGKDRPGYLRRLGVNRWVGEMVIESLPGGGVDLAIEPADAAPGDFRPTVLMERVSQAVEREPGLSITGLRTAVTGNSAYVDKARGLLVDEGFIEARRDGQATRFYPVEPYTTPAETGGSDG